MLEKTGTDGIFWGNDALFRALIGATVDGVVVIDAGGQVRIFNTACERLFGYAPGEVIGRNVAMLMPEPYRGEHDGYLAHYRKTGERRIIGIGREVVGRRRDGSTFPMYLSVGESELDGEAFFVGVIRDLTALKAEIDQRESADRLLAQIVQSSDDGILSKTLDGVIISWNTAAARIFGYSAGEAIGRHISLLIPSERLAEENAIIAKIRAGEDVEHFETVRRRKDGRDIVVSISVSPVRDGAGNIFGASKTVRDISERKAAEARLQALQSELAHVARLNSMGQMSSALAHELNQPLTAITNFVEAARRTLDTPGEASIVRAKEMIDRAAAQALRAGATIRNLREFVEKRETNRGFVNVAIVVEEAMALATASGAAAGAKVILDLAPNMPRLFIDKVQMQQVLINLIRNAVEAMQAVDLRELTISTRRDGGNMRLSVCDTGPGLPPHVLASLFQPFVTTKENGMGIGLTICKSIVEAHDGELLAEARSGGGTCFVICLPLTAEVAAS